MPNPTTGDGLRRHGNRTVNIRLRQYPYPYRGLLALSSDLDGTRSADEYLELLRFLNTTRPTSMGDGIGIEFANSLYFDAHPTQFSYWNTDDETRGTLRALVGSGHIDSLHSLGGQAKTRAAVARTLDEIERHELSFPVFSNHSRAPTNFRSAQSNCSGSGDEPASEVYHADRSIAAGATYVWLGQTTSVMAQGVRPKPFDVMCRNHRMASLATAARQTVKVIAGRLSRRHAMHARNEVLRETRLADGQPVLEFLRSNAHWAGIRHGESGPALGQVLRPETLQRLVRAGGVSIVYTHLGKRPRNGSGLLTGATVEALRRLAAFERRGQLLVLTTARALDYCALLRCLDYRYEDHPEGPTVRLDLVCPEPLRGRLLRCLHAGGLTFYVREPKPVRVLFEDRPVGPLTHNPADHSGDESISLPLLRPALPEQV